MALSSYGDSEAESEDEDEEDAEVGAALDHGCEEDEDDFDSGTYCMITACLLHTYCLTLFSNLVPRSV